MNKFVVGDIVNVKRFTEKAYYIVTDIINLTNESDEQPHFEYEICKIYPTTVLDDFSLVYEKDLDIVAKNLSKESGMILVFIKNELKRMGVFGDTSWERRIRFTQKQGVVDSNKDNKEIEVTGKINVKKKSTEVKIPPLNSTSFARMMRDNTGQELINLYLDYLDIHLKYLQIAIDDSNQKDIDLHISKLHTVRQRLMELEFFSLK